MAEPATRYAQTRKRLNPWVIALIAVPSLAVQVEDAPLQVHHERCRTADVLLVPRLDLAPFGLVARHQLAELGLMAVLLLVRRLLHGGELGLEGTQGRHAEG